jgi:hypothetical protein
MPNLPEQCAVVEVLLFHRWLRQERGMLEEPEKRAEEYNFVERVRAIETLFTFATGSPEEECQRRGAAINALTALCRLQESQGFRRRKDSSTIKSEQEEIAQAIVRRSSLSASLPVECMSTQCIFCLGNEELSAPRRLWSSPVMAI